jgi:p-hydroxybenzoate 3-monooxygenase
MTSMLHRFPDASDFALRRQVAELEGVTGTRTGSAYVAENYVGLPFAQACSGLLRR